MKKIEDMTEQELIDYGIGAQISIERAKAHLKNENDAAIALQISINIPRAKQAVEKARQLYIKKYKS